MGQAVVLGDRVEAGQEPREVLRGARVEELVAQGRKRLAEVVLEGTQGEVQAAREVLAGAEHPRGGVLAGGQEVRAYEGVVRVVFDEQAERAGLLERECGDLAVGVPQGGQGRLAGDLGLADLELKQQRLGAQVLDQGDRGGVGDLEVGLADRRVDLRVDGHDLDLLLACLILEVGLQAGLTEDRVALRLRRRGERLLLGLARLAGEVDAAPVGGREAEDRGAAE